MSADRCFHDHRGDYDVEPVGPFSRYPVVVNGWTVKGLQAQYADDGSVSLVLDERFALDVPADRAASVIEFVADALAIGRGWSCHPRSENWTPDNEIPPMRLVPWHQLRGITFTEEDDA